MLGDLCLYLTSGMNSSVTLHAGYLDVKTKGRLGDVSYYCNIHHEVVLLMLCLNIIALSSTVHFTSKQCNAWEEMAGGERSQWISDRE